MLYYKIINDRMVIDSCKTIQMEDGTWVSNPSEVQIAEAGWLPYVPPEVEPVKTTEPGFEEVVNAVKRMLAASAIELSDEEALEVAAIYPTWVSVIGKEVNTGERYWFNEKLYKVVQTHTAQMDWEPDDTPALYTEVSIVEWPEIPESIPAEAPWMKGDRGTWKGQHYICQMDNCVWNPDQYPQAWSLA